MLYQDTVCKMGIDPSRIKPTKTTFKCVIPRVEARCTGSIKLEVVFGSPDNFQSEELIFDIVPFRSGYHALLGRTASARFNAVPHYAYLKLKMPGPREVITVNGKMDRSLVQRNTLRPLRPKYNAAYSGKPPIRRRQPQAPSSEGGTPRNRITRHAKSMTSSPASAQIPAATFVPRVHNYALKVPWASAEAKYGQAYSMVRPYMASP